MGRTMVAATGLLLAAACGGKGENPDVSGQISFKDANNYSFTGAIDIPSVETASATDLTMCFDNLVSDIQCHDVDPVADIDTVGLVRFRHLSQAEVEEKMAADDLQQADQDGYVEVSTGTDTCVDLSAMSFFGSEFDLETEYVEGGGTYLVLVTTGATPGVGSRLLSFIEPKAASTTTDIDLGDGCGALDFTVDLRSLETVPMLVDGPWEVDWEKLDVDGQGNALSPSDVDGLMVAWYETATLDDLQQQFLDLELIADELWTIDLSAGRSADLADAKNAAGDAFTGFDRDGVWLVALRCSLCYNPAPLFLTVVEPVEG